MAVPLSNTERFSRLPRIVSPSEVVIKTAASAKVRRVKKLAPPELPKTVLLEPPREALMSAPFPDCIKTTRTIKAAVTMWTTVRNVIISVGFNEIAGGPQVQCG